MKKTIFLLTVLLAISRLVSADDGYRLWLKYDLVRDEALRAQYRTLIRGWVVNGNSATADVVRNEFRLALPSLLGVAPDETGAGNVIVGTVASLSEKYPEVRKRARDLNDEGFVLCTIKKNASTTIAIAGKTEVGMLYGAYHFLKLLQTQRPIGALDVVSNPKTKIRILNHWDNLDRTVERGYAGFSIWDWHKLPDYIDPRYHDYARANASVGINGAVLTNVNANALILTPYYLEKVKALADVFRPYGIRVYLTARFSAPIEIGGLQTADPLDANVRRWWKEKIDEIYRVVPDFGGFTVKANSEGQPGPQNYQRTHADGANMLADAISPHNGIVMWRAFVYDNNVPVDRTKQAYDEFKPLDGSFRDNVMVQVKNGPLDFQPREPFHPLFGAMPATPLMMEFQITQEYLGQATHLVYLAPMYKECLNADTYAKGRGSTVGKVIDGTLEGHALTGMAGVANIGNDRNWCGHPIAQSNWYAFGRLAWDHALTAEAIADEWIRMTYGNDPAVVATLTKMMMASREITVQYMTPLGLHHIMGYGHHYGPGPWVRDKPRLDWTSVYYHKADEKGLGFNRSSTGTNALEQYAPEVRKRYEPIGACPEAYLMWFHHVPWDHTMKSGRTLWEELCHAYHQGADSVTWMQRQWASLEGKVDPGQHAHVKQFLAIQAKEARWWRDACLAYFRQFSGREIPEGLEQPAHDVKYYESLEFPYAPGIRPRW